MTQSKYVLLFGLLLPIGLHAQFTTPLHQVMSSNSLIDRPMVFRDLQQEIQKVYGEVKPGIQLGYFYEKMSTTRKHLLDKIKAPRIVVDTGRAEMRIQIGGLLEDTLKVPKDESPRQMIDNLQQRFSDTLEGQIKKIPLEEKTKDAVIAALLTTLKEAGISKVNAPGTSVEHYQKEIAALISFTLFQKAKEELERVIPEYLLSENTVGVLGKRQREVQATLDAAAAELHDRVAQALDKAEDEIAKVVQSYSQTLISGNTGVAVTEGTGTFSGGVQFSYVQSASLQFGAYFNQQFGKGDTASKSVGSLIGVQVKLAGDQFQYEVLYSRLISPEQVPKSELGLGFSCRVKKDLIIGLALFAQFPNWIEIADLDKSKHIIGIMVKGASPDSPSLLLGTTLQKGKADTPVFQISMPIAASQ